MSFEESINLYLKNSGVRYAIEYILDKADKIPLSHRTRKIAISVSEEIFPELFYPEKHGDDELLEEAIYQLCVHGVFELKSAAKKKFLPLAKRNAKLYFIPDFENLVRSFYARPIKDDKWKKVLNVYPFKSQKAKEILSCRPIQIKEKDPIEIIERFDEWAMHNKHKGTARQESARCFWGMSKLFDNREDIIETFGLKETPIMLNVYSFTSQSSKILFIENLDTFNAVMESNNPIFTDTVIIYSSGYKASAKRIRERSGSKIFFEHDCKFTDIGRLEFLSWFYEEAERDTLSFFWGDLDYSGIGILLALQEKFQSISIWRPGYDQMVKSLRDKNGHTPNMAKKENQIRPFKNTGCAYVDTTLLEALDNFGTFVDQEIVDIEKI